MAASVAQIMQLRRMVGEVGSTTYQDADLRTAIEHYPIMDANGEEPTEPSTTTGLEVTNTDWTATYDLNAAAAEIWQEKGAAVADRNDFDADGGSYKLSQQYEQAMKMARHYQSRRAVKSMRLWPTPRPILRDPWEEV